MGALAHGIRADDDGVPQAQGEVQFTSRDAGLTISHQMLRVNDTVTVLPGVLHSVRSRCHPIPTHLHESLMLMLV